STAGGSAARAAPRSSTFTATAATSAIVSSGRRSSSTRWGSSDFFVSLAGPSACCRPGLPARTHRALRRIVGLRRGDRDGPLPRLPRDHPGNPVSFDSGHGEDDLSLSAEL